MGIVAYKINSFAISEDGGNPAGVVLHADQLSEEQMKAIAKKMNFSETAFVMKSDAADYKVRFFTPVEEVDLCGHATIGTYSLMLQKKLILPGKYTQETKAGILNIQVMEDGMVMMDQAKPQYYEVVDREILADSLNISVDDFELHFMPQIVSTGLKDIMIPIRNRSILDRIKPDFNKITAVSKKYGVVGYHLFCKDTVHNSSAYCRNFAPLYGIIEESATGTSSGALACYLKRYEQKNDAKFIFEQGYSMGKPSEIQAMLTMKGSEIIRVQVGGRALNIRETILE